MLTVKSISKLFIQCKHNMQHGVMQIVQKKCPDVIKGYEDKEMHQTLRNYAYLN